MSRQQKIRIKRKKIIMRSRDKSRKQLILFFQRYKRRLLVAVILILLIVVLGGLYFSSSKKEANNFQQFLEKSKSRNTANFPYLEILPDEAHHHAYWSKSEPEYMSGGKTVEELLYEHLNDKNDIRKIISQINNKKIPISNKAGIFYKFSSHTNPALKDFFIYGITADSFAVITLSPTPKMEVKVLDTSFGITTLEGRIKTYIENAIHEKYKELSVEISEIQKALSSQIDLHHDIDANDDFKLIYEAEYYKNSVSGRDTILGLGNLLAVHYKKPDNNVYSFRYEENGEVKYFNEEGYELKKQFLKSPVEYNPLEPSKEGIITSSYGERIHPVYRTRHTHLGTDYMANLNDPVYAVGDGMIVKAVDINTKNNGKYVKIKHSIQGQYQYQTQYLHLNKLGKGIKPYKEVKQGEIIGYAGSTGLSTGVHVCFRFWKGDRQVDHTKESLFQSIKSEDYRVEDLDKFIRHKNKLMDIFKNS